MFEQALAVEYARSNRAWTTLVGMAGQAAALAAAIILPITSPDTLPRPQTLVQLFMPHAPVAPAPPPPAALAGGPRVNRPGLQFRGVLTEPGKIPPRPVLIEEPPLTAAELGGTRGGVPGGMPGGSPDGIPGGLPGEIAPSVAPPAPVAKPVENPAPPRPAQRIRQGGEVQAGLLIHKVLPVYPPLARQARVAGTVELAGVVGVDGRIRQLQVVRGHVLLIGAAVEAVRQWVYRPTFLNGDPVEVIAPITVEFILQ